MGESRPDSCRLILPAFIEFRLALRDFHLKVPADRACAFRGTAPSFQDLDHPFQKCLLTKRTNMLVTSKAGSRNVRHYRNLAHRGDNLRLSDRRTVSNGQP